ncbi:MAG: STAS domain-containing protein [Roseburia sp.]|nr:STAS domain-containing protein [Ruminococcus sp.]MCM1156407.1 STAS domain-containing protein [Roseburia sp.]MCM1242233.1 STAS domain-containing protein [Roseburia sp.]
MKIESEKKEEKLTLWLSGRLDTTTAPQLQQVMDTELEDIKDLQIDMEQLEYVSSAGLRVLLAASKKIKAAGGSMSIQQANDDIKEVFEITGFKDFIDIR